MSSVAERYLRASNSGNLRLTDGNCDADVILAAAYSSSGDPRKMLALKVWRMKQQGNTRGFEDVVDECITSVRSYHRGMPLSQAKAKDVARKTLFWWLNPSCEPCNGLGYPVIKGTPMLDHSKPCVHCDGTGVAPLEALVTSQHANSSRRLADDLNRLCSIVFSDMAHKLRRDMELS